MNKITITLVLLSFSFFRLQAQETVIDSINTSKFTGIVQGGEIEQSIFVPYFSTNKTDKKNFIIRQLNSQNFVEEYTTRLELPDTYILKNSIMNGGIYLLYFYDEAKKEDVMITVQNSNIVKKKIIKSSGSTLIPLSSGGSPDFILVSINPKGNYTVEMLDKELESKWKKTHSAPSGTTWDIISVKAKMDGTEIIRKENKPGNKYAFVIHRMSADNGADAMQATIGNNELNAYPTFFSEKDGMSFTGGFYYKNGIYANQPDGVFFANLMPDGQLNQVASVPYSQVVEDVKSSLGDKFVSGNSTIIFSGGMMIHETQTYIMTGQAIKKEPKEGGCTIETGDFITVKFNFEQKYIDATAAKTNAETISLNGDVTKANVLDIGIWLKNASLLSFRYFVNSPGNPLIAYSSTGDGGMINLCFRNVGVKNDTTRNICFPVTRDPQKAITYKFPGITAPNYPVTNYNITTNMHDFMHITIYELNKSLLFIRKTTIPDLEPIKIRIMPEPPHHHEEQNAPAEKG